MLQFKGNCLSGQSMGFSMNGQGRGMACVLCYSSITDVGDLITRGLTFKVLRPSTGQFIERALQSGYRCPGGRRLIDIKP